MKQKELKVDILIVGGSLGGCAAAIAATSLGKKVIMTEETDWIGGQLTSQAVPPDEHRWIESFGCTRRYRRFRNLVRDYYKRHYPLNPTAVANPHLNPGQGTVSRLCHEPKVALAVLYQMMAYAETRGDLQIHLNRKPISVEAKADQIEAVTFIQTINGETETVAAGFVLDATETGDLLSLGRVEYVSGAESQAETGEPHAVPGESQPDNVQGLTWCLAMGYDPEGSHVIDELEGYQKWRDYIPDLSPAWPGKMLSWAYSDPITLTPKTRMLFPSKEEPNNPSFWPYRRLISQQHYLSGMMPHEVTLVNWPCNDYIEGNIIDQSQEVVDTYLKQARELSLSLFYWMQTEAPRPDGGYGYPGLYLRPDITGTDDGLAKAPYIRESRRIRAEFTVTEMHVGQEARGTGQAANFPDSIGIGCYRIDLHPSTGKNNYIDISSLPFQIPLGALIPIRVENLIPACKNIGTTHITNGCYRLHPIEWNIGEAAGLLSAFSLTHRLKPRQIYQNAKLLQSFQTVLLNQGIELEWPTLTAV